MQEGRPKECSECSSAGDRQTSQSRERVAAGEGSPLISNTQACSISASSLVESVEDPSQNVRRSFTKHEWAVLAVLTLPCALYSMDLTVMELAVPTLSVQLKPTAMQLLWILDIYGFVLAGMLIPMGALGERIGRRRLLLLGAGAFALASVGAAFARNAAMLIAMRAALGMAGATVAPTTLSLIRQMFEKPLERARAVGVWVAAYSAGAGLGPLVGGYLLQEFWWGSIFLISLPVMLAVLLLGPRVLPEYRAPQAARIDLLSAVLSLFAVLAVIFGLKIVAEYGATLEAAAVVSLGVLLGIFFVNRQARLEQPLIDMDLLRIPTLIAGLTVYALASFVSFGALVFVAQYMQLVLGLSPLVAGLWGMPFALTLVVGSSAVPWLERRLSRQSALSLGLLVAAAGFSMLCLVNSETSPAAVAGLSCVYALGLACVFTVTADSIVGAAPLERAGTASAVSETSSELGGALGIALLGSVGFAVYRSSLHARLPLQSDTLPPTLGEALQLAGSSGAQSAKLITACRAAFVDSLHVTSAISTAILIGAAVFTLRRRRAMALRYDG